MDKVHWRLANDESNRLEVSFTNREFPVEEFQPLSRSVEELDAATATASTATARNPRQNITYNTRANKRLKLSLETEEEDSKTEAEAVPSRLWPTAQRARIWFCREQLLTLDDSANDATDISNISVNDAMIAQRRRQQQQQHQEAALQAHQTLDLIGYHTPQLVHCTLFASATTTPITVEGAVAAAANGSDIPVVVPRPRYISAESLSSFLKQTRGTLQSLDLIGLSPYSTNPQAYEELQQTLRLSLSSKYALLDVRYVSLQNICFNNSWRDNSSTNGTGVVPSLNRTVLSCIPPVSASLPSLPITTSTPTIAASPKSMAQSQWVRTLLLGSCGGSFDADDNPLPPPQLYRAATAPATAADPATATDLLASVSQTTAASNISLILKNIVTTKEPTTRVRSLQLEDAGFLDASMAPILSQFAAASATHPHRLLYLRLDIVLCVATVTPVVELLLTNGRNLGLLGLGLLQQTINKNSASAKKHDKDDSYDDDATMTAFRQLTQAIGIARVDNVKLWIDNALVESKPGFMTLCTDMLRYNYSCSHFEANLFGRSGTNAGDTPRNHNNSDQQPIAEVSVINTNCSDNWRDDTAAFLQMNCKFRHKFLAGFDPEFTTSEGWVKLVENLKSADLPPEQSVTCLYLCLRQYPNAISNQLMSAVEITATAAAERNAKGKDTNSTRSNNIEDDEHLQMLKQHLAAMRTHNHLESLLQLETEMYNIGCSVSLFHDRIVMLETNLAKTKKEMVEMLNMVAELKQVTSGDHGRPLRPSETELYRRVGALLARLESNRDICFESITPIRVENIGHISKITECKRVIRDLLRERRLE